ncbi:TolC family outer membrane protein [Undibacterium terreum]|uniref:Outer membrane protein n=1 Tax=Undibacterium terreum TaxID=1224302 RepID=A0A916UQ75_9BURK|nr:TolC family outer membrane protein [Undibacterium terreum]GGC82968.1 outer membrane protein [Undibacterium terreum]
MRKPIIAVLIAGAFLSSSAGATDLLQIYKDALLNDAQFGSARASLAAGQEKPIQGRALILPTIAITGSDVRARNEISPDGFPGNINYTGNTNAYSLSLSQPLFRWANWQQYQQGKLALVVSEAQFALSQQDLITRVAQAYFDVLAAQDTLTTLQAQKVAISEQLASAKRNFEVGTSTITDTHEAQARYDLTVAQEFAGVSDLQIKRAALQQIIGKEAGDLALLKPGIKLSSPQPERIDDWVSSAEKQNYNVIASQVNLEIAQRDIQRNRAGHYPTLDLVASSGRNSTGGVPAAVGTNSVAKTNSIGVQWSIPIFSGFGVDSRVRESIALEDKARNDLEFARRTSAQGARQSYFGVNSGLAQVKALEAAEVSSQSALDSNKLGYQVGVRINIDVLNAQQQLYTTQRDLAKARYDTIMNGLRLKSAAGTLKEEDLAEVNALLQH